MNSINTPAYVKNNNVTRLLERIAQINAEEGKPAGRAVEQAGEHFRPLISAYQFNRMSPQQQQAVLNRPGPMDPRELQRANIGAMHMGINPNSDDPDDPNFQVPFDDTGVTEEEIEEMTRELRPKSMQRPVAERTAETMEVETVIPRATARETVSRTLPRGVPMQTPRLPDFKNVAGFDLERGVVVVDGLEFPLDQSMITKMKMDAIQIVLSVVTLQLAQALVALGIPEELAKTAAETARQNASIPGGMQNGGKEEVSPVPSPEVIEPVQQETIEMSVLSEKDLQELSEAESREDSGLSSKPLAHQEQTQPEV